MKNNLLFKRMQNRVAQKLETKPEFLDYEGWEILDILDFHSLFFGSGGQNKK